MSTCISRHGEYSSHEPDADYVCKLCAVLDEDALIAELNRLRVPADAFRDEGYCRAIADVHQRLATELRSTAKRVPTDVKGRAGYRKALRVMLHEAGELLVGRIRGY